MDTSEVSEPVAGAVIYASDFVRLSNFYSRLLGFVVVENDTEHVLLRSASFELVIITTAQSRETVDVTAPPTPRMQVAIKPVFYVNDLAAARATAHALGGGLKPKVHEWHFRDCIVCDGFDPEGNIFQLRQREMPRRSS